jgi:hypothetical protein
MRSAMPGRADFHENFGREDEVVGPTDRNFGVTFAVLFALFAALSWWNGHDRWPYWLGASAVFLACALFAPAVLAPLNKVWLKFGLLLHKIVNPIVMAFLFFLCVLPMALVMRALGKQFLQLRVDRGARTYWVPREPSPAPDAMKNQF